MKIILGTDHAGFDHKEKIKSYLKELGYSVHDDGAFEFSATDDYPDFIKIVAMRVANDQEDARGIIFGASGQGEAIVANRFPGVRAVVYYGGDDTIVRLSREHNDSNILSIGARFVSADEAKLAIKLWLDTPFSGEERHSRRINKIDSKLQLENEF